MNQSRLRFSVSFLAVIGYLGLIALSPSASAEEQKRPGPPPAKGGPAHPGAGPGHPEMAPGHGPMEHGPEHDRMVREHLDRDHHVFGHRDFAHFDARERRLWQAGRWHQTCFDGRCGWWWSASGIWHFYDRPIYPYPLAVSEVVYVEPVVVAPVTPVVVAPAAPVVVAPPPQPMAVPPSAAAQTRYYCDNPPGYYPAVQNCNGEFRPVAP